MHVIRGSHHLWECRQVLPPLSNWYTYTVSLSSTEILWFSVRFFLMRNFGFLDATCSPSAFSYFYFFLNLKENNFYFFPVSSGRKEPDLFIKIEKGATIAALHSVRQPRIDKNTHSSFIFSFPFIFCYFCLLPHHHRSLFLRCCVLPETSWAQESRDCAFRLQFCFFFHFASIFFFSRFSNPASIIIQLVIWRSFLISLLSPAAFLQHVVIGVLSEAVIIYARRLLAPQSGYTGSEKAHVSNRRLLCIVSSSFTSRFFIFFFTWLLAAAPLSEAAKFRVWWSAWTRHLVYSRNPPLSGKNFIPFPSFFHSVFLFFFFLHNYKFVWGDEPLRLCEMWTLNRPAGIIMWPLNIVHNKFNKGWIIHHRHQCWRWEWTATQTLCRRLFPSILF